MCLDASTMASTIKMDKSSSFIKLATTQFLQLSPDHDQVDSTNKGIGNSTNKASNKEQLLVDYNSLPEFLQHNEFILNYYRSEWPFKQTLLSVFSIHNETLNIWTHLIGFFIFLMLAGYAASVFPIGTNSKAPLMQMDEDNSTNTFIPSVLMAVGFHRENQATEPASASSMPLMVISRWPFYLYLAGAMFCLLMSSACHLLSCHCSRTSYIMLRLDFAGITALIVSSFYPIVYYSFTCNPFFRDIYLFSITIFGLAAFFMSLIPVFDSPQFRPVRAVLFACMAASGAVPITHKMIAFGNRPEAVLTTGYEAVMGMFYGLGVVVYAMRIPERWLPGKFDLAGHSHQLFHILVIAGAYTNYLASLVYLGWRETEGC